jgi:hypothetical protein
MSSAVVSTSAAPGRPFLFDVESASPGETAAPGCPVERSSTSCEQELPSTVNRQKLPPATITRASHLAIRPAPEMVTSGIPALDALTGGLPRGCLTEICGPPSSGRTSVMLAALASATRRGEYCAVIDAGDVLDPHSAMAAGVDLERLLWVRCGESRPRGQGDPEKTNRKKEKELVTNNGLRQGSIQESTIRQGSASAVPCGPFTDPASAAGSWGLQPMGSAQNSQARTDKEDSDGASRNRKQSEHCLEQVLRATDLLLESGGFGLIILDLADVPHPAARRIPLTTWFRFRRAVEHKPTILLAIEQKPIAGSCSSLLLQLGVVSSRLSVFSSNLTATRDLKPSHAQLFVELKIHAELIRSRLDRKPARSVAFETKTAWAG